ncbi:hypothetical protein [Leptospira santarosai]|uniref:hypothetical protein n=1 Tax=Leptospira santarosai TaxID=28183 RepID=UPI003D15FEA4
MIDSKVREFIVRLSVVLSSTFYNKVFSFLNLLKKHFQSEFVKSQPYYLQKFLKRFKPLVTIPHL